MRSCLWRFGRLGQGLQWSLLLAVLIFLLFALPSFIKEPSTRPSRMVRATGPLLWCHCMGGGSQ
uniref:ST6 N-acetylgalactosaminide alpha-2,6-sialyltransferase 1 n=1 Tax=Propithecus coquereli TaxID=379532 RepID=A0A2K6GVT8_PROCO